MDFEGAFFDTTDYEPTNKMLGKGSFGKVFVVNNTKDGKQYAAKLLNPDNMLKSKDQMMLLREVQILCKLDHPSIVKFYGINFHSFLNPTQLEPTILTEYLKNGSLKKVLDKEKNSIADLNWSPTKKYINLLGISDAMRYLHSKGVLHRDLKPENILIDENYYPRVCDFGLSRCFPETLTKSMQLVLTQNIGSPLYMAPEVLDDKGGYGPGVDVYAFAFLAYEIVARKEPYSENGKPANISTLFRKIGLGIRPEFPAGVPEQTQKLISSCWSKEPKDRPSFEEIFNTLSNDRTCIGEDVDEDEVDEYLEALKEAKDKDKEKKNGAVKENGQDQKANTIKERPSSFRSMDPIFDLLIDLSNLKIDQCIGRGELYEVFRGLIKEDQLCAVRYPLKIEGVEDQKRFFSEIQCQHSLNHKAVLPLIGYSIPNKSNGTYAIITDLMPNGSLHQLIEMVNDGNAPDDWETIRAINIFGIAAGMAYIHQHNVIHRDLSAYNIFLDESYHPKIGGFADAKFLEQGALEDNEFWVGTPFYMAPEIFECEPYSNKADVYSYAIMLYELMTYKKPYEEVRNVAIIHIARMIVDGRRPKIYDRDIPKIWIELINRCWDSNPDNRPTFIEIVKELMDNREDYFDLELIREEELCDYIDDVIACFGF
ncbi:hypothetical protein M9Y10_042943 [Tritrichomonas musculus]|uniref:Protein kinase domain-containing protein n=1 Tax=Tritrichomonas musculus TaxID=1915356 RepID=A0ABR2JYA8_9EUKA